MNRTLAIGDVHGRFDELLRVLDYIQYGDSDRLIFLGDYIDRGSQSREVMDFLVEIKKNRENIFLRGNHEDMFLKLSQGNASLWSTWLEDGEGRKCLMSYGIDPDRFQNKGENCLYTETGNTVQTGSPAQTVMFFLGNFPVKHLELIRDTVLSYESGDFFFSHAGAQPGLQKNAELSKQPEYMLVWGDDSFGRDRTDYGKILVYGHYHHKAPAIGFKRIGLAVDGKVAALDIKNMVVVDSDGNFTEARPELLLGGFYRE